MPQINRRQLLMAGAVSAAVSSVLPSSAETASAAQPSPAIEPMSLVDPELRSPLQVLLKAGGNVPVSAANLGQMRRGQSNSSTPLASDYEERYIPGAAHPAAVRVFVLNAAANGQPRPAILHIHGGGFVSGRAVDAIPALLRIAREHECLVVTVDYRLAPETRFPGSLEDNYAALKWMHRSAHSLGIDPSRIAVMGESAGGGHAAALAIAARDRGELPIAFQLLIYPMLDDRTGSVRRVPPYIGAYTWVAASNRFGWSSLLGVPAGSHTVPKGAVPARVQNLAGLPRSFIGVGSVDLFVDEDLDYARRLIDSGVPTEICVVPGGYHGFDVIAPDAACSKAFRATWNAALAKALSISASS